MGVGANGDRCGGPIRHASNILSVSRVSGPVGGNVNQKNDENESADNPPITVRAR